MTQRRQGYEVVMPKLGHAMTEARLVTWYWEEGDAVQKGDALFRLETEETALDVEAPVSGTLHRLREAGDVVPVREPVAVISGATPRRQAMADAPAAAPELPRRQARAADRVAATPKARAVARRRGVELAGIAGTGPRGMIVAADVAPAPDGAPLPLALRTGWQARPQATLFADVDATALVRLNAERDPGLSRDAFLLKAVALALRDCPALAARLTDAGLVPATEINVGLAVATGRGQVVVVTRATDTASLPDLSATLRALTRRAQAGRSLPDELAGGAFTVINLGQFAIDAFAPVIPPPESGILGVGRIAPRPVVVEGAVAVREMMTLALVFDPRVIDSAPAARCLQRIQSLLERPAALL